MTMTRYEERHLAALQQIGKQLKDLNRNISKFGFTVLPTQNNENKKDRETVLPNEAEKNKRDEEIEMYRAKIKAYEKQLKELPRPLIESPEPVKEIYRGMEVSQFGAK